MNVIVILLSCIGCIYAIYSLVNLFIRIKKVGIDNCVFKAPLSRWIIHGTGIILLVSAAVIFYEKEIKTWLLYVSLIFIVIIDFTVKNTQISK